MDATSTMNFMIISEKETFSHCFREAEVRRALSSVNELKKTNKKNNKILRVID
jgi:hypothetical protein